MSKLASIYNVKVKARTDNNWILTRILKIEIGAGADTTPIDAS